MFDKRDTWFVTGDIVRRDAEGDYWYVDRTAAAAAWAAWLGREPRDRRSSLHARRASSTRSCWARARATPATFARARRVVGRRCRRRNLGRCASPSASTRVRCPPAWPSCVPNNVRASCSLRTSIALTDGFRPLKAPLVAAGIDPDDPRLMICGNPDGCTIDPRNRLRTEPCTSASRPPSSLARTRMGWFIVVDGVRGPLKGALFPASRWSS